MQIGGMQWIELKFLRLGGWGVVIVENQCFSVRKYCISYL